MEYIEIEANLLILASTENVFHNRKSRVESITGFHTNYMDSWELVGDCGDVYRLIAMANFESIAELKQVIKKAEKYNWIFWNDSYLLQDGTEIYSEGKWLI